MATIQPTPLPTNSITDGEGTPPTTNQQTQEPVDPSEGTTGTAKLTAPATSEAATDLLILGPSESTDIKATVIKFIVSQAIPLEILAPHSFFLLLIFVIT